MQLNIIFEQVRDQMFIVRFAGHQLCTSLRACVQDFDPDPEDSPILRPMTEALYSDGRTQLVVAEPPDRMLVWHAFGHMPFEIMRPAFEIARRYNYVAILTAPV